MDGARETWPLELKRLKTAAAVGDDAELQLPYFYLYGNGSVQSFQAQIGPAGKDRIEMPAKEQIDAFKKLVKKEPKYESAHPFRAVAALGGKKFAFALDAVPPPKSGHAECRAAEKRRSQIAGQEGSVVKTSARLQSALL